MAGLIPPSSREQELYRGLVSELQRQHGEVERREQPEDTAAAATAAHTAVEPRRPPDCSCGGCGCGGCGRDTAEAVCDASSAAAAIDIGSFSISVGVQTPTLSIPPALGPLILSSDGDMRSLEFDMPEPAALPVGG